MKRIPWKYSAGLIDGDGCIDIILHKHSINGLRYIRPRVRISMAETSAFLLESFANSYGGNLIQQKRHSDIWQDQVSWQLSGYKNVCTFLRNIVNHLVLKKEQARFVLWLEANFKGARADYEVIKAAREELKFKKSTSEKPKPLSFSSSLEARFETSLEE